MGKDIVFVGAVNQGFPDRDRDMRVKRLFVFIKKPNFKFQGIIKFNAQATLIAGNIV